MADEQLTRVAEINTAMGRVSGLYIKWTQKHNVNYYVMKILYVLHVLNPGKPVTQKQISDEFSIPKQSINNIVVSLEQDGYLSLAPGGKDRREKHLVLTEKGETYAAGILTPLLKIEAGIVNRMKEQALLLLEAATAYGDYFELEMMKEDQQKNGKPGDIA